MGTIVTALPYILVSFIISLLLTPVVKKVGLKIDAYALENKRTVHHGKIVRIGGIAIFLAFIITMAIFVHPDTTFNAIIIGSAIVFLGGLIDDIFDLKPIIKFGIQLIGAIYVVAYGQIELTQINLPFGTIDVGFFGYVISVFWIVGVTNAINLIDGLDGLSCGVSLIVLCVIGFIAYQMRKIDVATVSLILSGAIVGILPYNFNPASIFIGDSGALFMGFMISCLSLLGFKSSTFVALVCPIIILFVPLADTSLAIIRRKLKGQKISEADRSHLHHVLMFKVGFSHKKTVLLLYLVTLMFGTSAIVMYYNQKAGVLMLAILCLLAWIFIELTGMIKPGFHPLISISRKLTGHPKKKIDAIFDANKIETEEETSKDKIKQ